MALKYGFFNSLNGDRKYNAEDIGRFLHGLISGGVYADRSDGLQVFIDNGLTVAVQPGRGMFDFHYLENDAVLYLTLATGNTLPRYDAIIAKLDYNNRQITIEVKQGTAASTPVKPAMERSETIKEYCLAYIYVDKLATTISQANITDTRPDAEVCGFVAGLIEQIDAATLFVQLEADFNAWFDTMKDQLTEDAAGNLQTQVDAVRTTAENAQNTANAAMPKFGGVNPITDTANDTVENWVALGSGLYFFDTNGQVTSKPDDYGWVFNIVSPDMEIRQLWFGRPSERIYHRGGNRSGFSSSWVQLIDTYGGGFLGNTWAEAHPAASSWTFKNNRVANSDGSAVSGNTAVIEFRRK